MEQADVCASTGRRKTVGGRRDAFIFSMSSINRAGRQAEACEFTELVGDETVWAIQYTGQFGRSRSV